MHALCSCPTQPLSAFDFAALVPVGRSTVKGVPGSGAESHGFESPSVVREGIEVVDRLAEVLASTLVLGQQHARPNHVYKAGAASQ
jgi:hypothetical protein